MSKRGRMDLQDEGQRAKLAALEKLWASQRKLDLKVVMSTPVGRRFIYDLLFEKCGLMNVYPAQDSGIYRHEGRREVGQMLAREIQQERPDEYVLMLNEHLQETQEYLKLREAALTPSANDGERS
jgi:hypothetical protein